STAARYARRRCPGRAPPAAASATAAAASRPTETTSATRTARLQAEGRNNQGRLAALPSHACTYELRDRSGIILATGRLNLEQQPSAGSSVRLGSTHAFVVDVQHRGDGPHLILEPL